MASHSHESSNSGAPLLGTGAVDGFQSQVVGYTVEFGGTADGTIRYNDTQNYLSWTNPVLELAR